jgi:prepilin-type N-terminal cleavage/methylation domain-containing protein
MFGQIRHYRAGFTLVELLLVLVLLVVIAATTVAALDGTVLHARIDEGAELVGSTWSDARSKAISDGVRVAFTCQFGGRDFRIGPCNDLAQTPEQVEAASTQGQLPEGVVFRAMNAAQRDTVPAGTLPIAGREGDWAPPILFDPDGTSYDAIVVLESEGGRQVELTLRGLTATSTVRDIPPKERVQ